MTLEFLAELLWFEDFVEVVAQIQIDAFYVSAADILRSFTSGARTLLFRLVCEKLGKNIQSTAQKPQVI